MSTSNRAARLTKTHKVLKKHYKTGTVADRPVLEHLLFACCLQSAPNEAADEAFARLQQAYYDWNEVRVTTVSELCEVLAGLPRPAEAASRLKRTLQAVFECYYSFDLEPLKKENIGTAVKQLEKLDGISKFAVAYVIQNGLGGHAIPVGESALECLRILGIVSDDEVATQRVPGLERAIAKNKGAEFGSLLHQLGNDYAVAPFSPRVRSIMLEIAADAKERFPKRASKREADESGEDEPTSSEAAAGESPADQEATTNTSRKAVGKKPDSKRPPGKKTDADEKKADGDGKKKASTKRLTKKKPR